MKNFKKIAKKYQINEAPKSLSYKRFGKESWQLDKDEKIQFAIENCRRIKITYDDKKGGKGKNTRYILPLVYGVTKNGKKAIRAFQTYGSTKRGVPKYKLFLFDNIGYVEVGRVKYYQYEELLKNTGFNDSGDKSFGKIYSITPLARNYNSANLANINKPIDSNPVSKSDITANEPVSKQQAKPSRIQPSLSKKTNVSIDKTEKTNYPSTIEAPETEPISKKQVVNGQESPNHTTDNEKLEAPDTEPVSKVEINGTKINKDNKLTKSYKDMMNRMDNLYKDDEEEKSEEENGNF